jgi:hypothetical protein
MIFENDEIGNFDEKVADAVEGLPRLLIRRLATRWMQKSEEWCYNMWFHWRMDQDP